MSKKLLIITSFAILSTGIISASAYTGSKTDYNAPKTWNQLDQVDVSIFGPNGYDWRMASCMIQAAAFAKVKIGAEDIGYGPKHLKLELDKVGGYSSVGYANYNKINFGNDWQLVHGSDEHGYIEANYNDMIRYYNEGYIVFVRVKSPAGYHQIAIDHIDKNGTIWIFDSGFAGQKFTDTYDTNSVTDVMLLKSNSGVKGYNLPTLYNQVSGQKIYAKIEQNGERAKTQADLDEEDAKAKRKAIEDAKRAKQLKDIEFAVSNAENFKDEKMIAYAQTLISGLDDKLKQEFLERLSKLKK